MSGTANLRFAEWDHPKPTARSMADVETTTHVLIVEDDPFIRDVISTFLAQEGFRVSAVENGADMFRIMEQDPAALVLMDLRLPSDDGLALTRQLRRQFEAGIIIVTSRQEIDTRVTGLEFGADDYITKPFDERELLARMKSVLRRTHQSRSADAEGDGDKWETFHGYRLNTTTGELRGPNADEIGLTGNEFKLLNHLVRNRGAVMSRERLMTDVLNRKWSPSDRSIDVLVTRVRSKIEPYGGRPSIIKTVRGNGYILTDEA
ncbi:MAG: response regulator transcription factor [Rhodobacteraceae bacterium]|nr:response regulator transcription factor [Paracoccaceae bacterium]